MKFDLCIAMCAYCEESDSAGMYSARFLNRSFEVIICVCAAWFVRVIFLSCCV